MKILESNKLNSRSNNIVPLFIVCITIAVIVLIPLKIMGYGFLPADDILRHVAKAISGRSWNDVLILREGINFDSHPGFHFLLATVYKITKFSPDALLSFASITLFIIFCSAPLFFIKRYEAWLLSLGIISLANFSFIMRLFFGRPYLVTMATLIILCLIWKRLRDDKRPYKMMLLIISLVTLSTWIHCSWYLVILPIVCFLIAREWRVAFIVSICSLAGVMIGATLTGSPIQFISQNITHAFLAFNNHTLPRTLVMEFRPFTGDIVTIIVLITMLLWSRMRAGWNPKKIYNPVFILIILSWVMGFFVARFWFDWGIPALLVWMSLEFDEALPAYMPLDSFRRLFLAGLAAVVLYKNITNDINDRWSAQPMSEYLSYDCADRRSWMPGDGGIVYSDDLRIFYLTFFKNPYASWRYMVGFEPAIMPEKDLDVFLDIQMSRGAVESFYPWINKMTPSDRLVITNESMRPPDIKELEWKDMGSGFWFGRRRSSDPK